MLSSGDDTPLCVFADAGANVANRNTAYILRGAIRTKGSALAHHSSSILDVRNERSTDRRHRHPAVDCCGCAASIVMMADARQASRSRTCGRRLGPESTSSSRIPIVLFSAQLGTAKIRHRRRDRVTRESAELLPDKRDRPSLEDSAILKCAIPYPPGDWNRCLPQLRASMECVVADSIGDRERDRPQAPALMECVCANSSGGRE